MSWTDWLTLTRALEAAGIERDAAERGAVEIVRAIDHSAGAKSLDDLSERQGRIAKAFESGGIERRAAEQIASVIVELIRQTSEAAP